jgi:hypothetical protein
MIGTRRSLLLLGLTVVAVFGVMGPAHPAQASFSEKVAAPTVQVATVTVAPPASADVSITCTKNGANLSASWPASATARVDGYELTVVYSDGFRQAATPMVTGTTWTSPTMSLLTASTYFMSVEVSAHTNYGWVSVPVASGAVRC